MTVSVQQFRDTFPGVFDASDAQHIAVALTHAARQVNPEALGANTDYAIALTAAHAIAMAPGGEPLRLDPKRDPRGYGSVYGRQLAELLETCVLTPVVI